MGLISKPQHWNEVVGQERAQRVLTGVIRNPEYMTRGFIFSGPEGVGKTTTAYLFAKAIMCQSVNPFECRDCPSCLLFTEDDIERGQHPDFEEIDAASLSSGADASRDLITLSNSPPHCAKRRVVLVDEAHRLSQTAWDVYLKPLELRGTDTIFIFSTTERVSDPNSTVIPKTIRSRSTVIEFFPVVRDSILGLLMAKADSRKIPYTLAGLRRVADLAAGRPRTALTMLQSVAVVGQVTPENCAVALTEDLSRLALDILLLLVRSAKASDAKGGERMIAQAITVAEEAAQVSGVPALIQAVFETYARKFFERSEIAQSLTNYKAITAMFLKWSQSQQIPIDALPLFLMELAEFLPGGTPTFAQPETREMLIQKVTGEPGLLADNVGPSTSPPLSVAQLLQQMGVSK